MGELLMYAAYLDHEAWMEPLFFLGETEEFRDEYEFPEDDEWIDECFTEGWSIGSGEVSDA